MESRRLLRHLVPVLVIVSVTLAARDAVPLQPSPGTPPGGESTVVRGTERIAWNQETAIPREIATLSYAVYVDGVRAELTDVRCASTSGPNAYACSAPLPALTPGEHVLEVATIMPRRGRRAESARSAPLRVTLGTSTGAAPSSAEPPVASDVEAAERGETEADAAITLPDGTRLMAQTVVSNLDGPSAIAFGSDGRSFIGERSGRVLAFDGGRLLNTTVLEGVAAIRDAGLLGLALHPDFARNRLVYVVDTAMSVDRTLGYRLSRFREVNGVLGERAILLDDVPATAEQAAAVIRFGPDGKLYVSFGRADLEPTASLSSYNGSLLRLNDDGSTPDDNPQSSPVYSFGHHIPRGFDWDRTSGDLWEVERVDTERDELNRIVPGGDYGDDQPAGTGGRQRTGTMPPVVAWPAALGPSGAAIYDRALIASLRGDLIIAALEGQDLVRVRFDSRDRTRAATSEGLFQGRFGRIGRVEVGPDGAIYFLTSNRGHDVASARDDRLIRLVPASR